MPEKSRAAANDITTLGCSRANYICQAQPGRVTAAANGNVITI